MAVEPDEDRFLTRREAGVIHANSAEAIDKALETERVLAREHNLAHAKAHEAHEEKHDSENEAVKVALASVDRERLIHSEAHDREHYGHQREHGLNNLAIEKAESATDKRFSSSNAFREQLNDMIRQLAPKETLDVFTKEVDRRFEDVRKDTERRHEELRQAITTLERTDVKAEGRGIGQGAMVAYIVTAISVLGSLIVLSNLLTGTP